MGSSAIVIAGGGTGGHIYPALALAEELGKRRPEIPLLFVGTRRGLETRIVPEAGHRLELVHAAGIAGKSMGTRLVSAALVPVAMLQSIRILWKSRARVVVGVGGYASGPTVMAARLIGRATMILEQNAAPGSTNRILAPLVNHVAVAFQGTASRMPGNVVVTGNPVRASMVTPARPDQDGRGRDGVIRLLIFGGSRGARGLNRAVSESLPVLEASELPLQIVHQTGDLDHDSVSAAYAATGLDATVLRYIDDMAEAYAGADLVICRAGATTVSELSAVGRAAVMIPLPHSTGGHQEENAKEMAAAGAAVLMREAESVGGRLADLVLSLLRDPERRREMETAARALGSPGAAGRVADLVLGLYDRRGGARGKSSGADARPAGGNAAGDPRANGGRR